MVPRPQPVPDLRLSTPVRRTGRLGPGRAEHLSRWASHLSDLSGTGPTRYEYEAAEGPSPDLPHDGVRFARGTITNTRWSAAGRGSRFPGPRTDTHALSLNLVQRRIPAQTGCTRAMLHPRSRARFQNYKGLTPRWSTPKWEELSGGRPGAQGPQGRPLPADLPRDERPAQHGPSSSSCNRCCRRCCRNWVDPLPGGLVASPRHAGAGGAPSAWPTCPPTERAGVARRRLAFNELLLLQLGIALKRHYTATMLQAPALALEPSHRRAHPPAVPVRADRLAAGGDPGDPPRTCSRASR